MELYGVIVLSVVICPVTEGWRGQGSPQPEKVGYYWGLRPFSFSLFSIKI